MTRLQSRSLNCGLRFPGAKCTYAGTDYGLCGPLGKMFARCTILYCLLCHLCCRMIYEGTQSNTYLLFAANVILDLRTAHRNLTVSEDGKQVRFSDRLLPDSPLRFSKWYGILGNESFSSGRHYYEVEVGTRGCFSVGFVKESVERMKYIVTSENGFLLLILEKNVYNVSTTPLTSLSLNDPPKKVGAYVDYERGQVSFYNVDTRSHIYSFTGYNFSEKLYPAVNPCNSMTSGPLIISPGGLGNTLLPVVVATACSP
uniref:B30.2/SPRY domain-containing protein n=1 Tax=Paramormyrops kingsleyae TaxID=1676925 RepID=A0A3B3RL80_9TELE